MHVHLLQGVFYMHTTFRDLTHQIVGGIDEAEQKPLTPEEEKLSKEITKLEMEFNRKQSENSKDDSSS